MPPPQVDSCTTATTDLVWGMCARLSGTPPALEYLHRRLPWLDSLEGICEQHSLGLSGRTFTINGMQDRLVFPVWSDDGQVAGLRGRTWRQGDMRLKISSWYRQEEHLPFGLNLSTQPTIESLRFTVVVEGEIDCLSLWASGFPCVASSRTSLGRYQAERLAELVDCCVIWPDQDTRNPKTGKRPGEEGAKRTCGLLRSLGVAVKVAEPGCFDNCKDAADCYQQYGPTSIQQFLELVVGGL